MYFDNQLGGQILEAFQNEAATAELYRQLAANAPDPAHQATLHQAFQAKHMHLNQLNHLYMSITGQSPDSIHEHRNSFHTYQEGLQQAYENEMRNYQINSYLSQQAPMQQIFIHGAHQCAANASHLAHLSSYGVDRVVLKDFGPNPHVVDIEEATLKNDTFRTAIWTGENLQVTVMSIDVDDDIGLEIHPEGDQFIRVEQGEGLVQMGDTMDQLTYQQSVEDDDAIMIPAGKWHNITNTGDEPLKVYVIYAPPEHPAGTVHETKADAMEAEGY
ncbi:cupin domain-containing protein [Thalassobacillus hwangdonensis]|uniref:Cupin domain-containing protein n=1 Tax=Thalassobacillus hwangdonensis TaxID=546108 RepID=A0ABW3L0P8_9BACI